MSIGTTILLGTLGYVVGSRSVDYGILTSLLSAGAGVLNTVRTGTDNERAREMHRRSRTHVTFRGTQGWRSQ